MPDLTNGVAAPPRRRCPPAPDADRAGHSHLRGDDLGRYPRPASSMPPRPLTYAFPTIQFATKETGACAAPLPAVRLLAVACRAVSR